MTSISSPNRWWQNWPKTHAYVAERMFFPRSADDIADAIRQAEADRHPVRAVGGGWSFSDASLPGTVGTLRPKVHAVEALSAAVPQATTFPISNNLPVIASIAEDTAPVDVAGSMVMHDDDPGSGMEPQIGLWAYAGAGKWTYGQWTYEADNEFLTYLADKHIRPIRDPRGMCLEEEDVAGSLVMVDMNKSPPRASRDWFYHGQGVWSVGLAGGGTFEQGTLGELLAHGRLAPDSKWSPRVARKGESLSLQLSRFGDVPTRPERVSLINTRSMVSSLQQDLPKLLSQAAIEATAEHPSTGKPRRFLFHVEAGITISELGELLDHQSPRLSLLAISGSPGATLAGALASATHGAEFNWPLLIDTVKAVHLVGPGGQQWWIEGDESIADPVKLRERYPGLAPERIITSASSVGGIVAQDWLNAAIVSMGTLGVLYSVVLEVVPRFGVHEAVVQTTWTGIASAVDKLMPDPSAPGVDLTRRLRGSGTSKTASRSLLRFLLDGAMNGSGIPVRDANGNAVNQYCDLAINPNRRPDGDFDCWIGNREQTLRVPIDTKPAASNEMGEMLKGITLAFKSPEMVQKLLNINKLGNLWDILWNHSGAETRLTRTMQSSDLIDVALDTFLSPMSSEAEGPMVAQAVLSGILAGLLGTANCDGRADKTGVSVGALGFPASGVMGTALEIALSPADAFGFLATEILDKVDEARPFMGYISIRICSMTHTLMGMQQFGDAANPYSVMIEVVAFASDRSLKFVHDLQQRTVDRIATGLDAMLHWGLENDLVTGKHLRDTPALQRPSHSGMSRLDTFKAVRGVIHAASPTSFRAFDNGFTHRLSLNADVGEDTPFSFQTVDLHVRKSVIVSFWNRGQGPMRVVGASVDGDFRTEPSSGRERNLEFGPFPIGATPENDFFELPVTFIAAQAGEHRGTMTIITHADGSDGVRVIKFRLHAQVDSFAITVIEPPPPAVLDLGSVALGAHSSARLTVRSDSTVNAWLDTYTSSDPAATPQIGVATTGVGPIAPGGTQSYEVSFQPTAVGRVACDLTLTFSDRVAPSGYSQQLVVKVVAVGVGAQARLSPASVSFGSVAIGAESAAVPVFVTNVGQVPLLITGVLIGVDFRLGEPLPSSIAPGQSVEAHVLFRPGHGGPLSSTFSISSDSAQPPVPVALEGVGLVVGTLSARPTALDYAGETPVGSESGVATVELSNDGIVDVTMASMSVTGPDATDFRVVSSTVPAGTRLRPEGTGQVGVVFAPTGAGRRRATLELSHDGAASPLLTGLHGVAARVAGVVPEVTDVDFGPIGQGASAKRRVVFTNADVRATRIESIALRGRDAAEFAVNQRVERIEPLEPGARFELIVSVRPQVIGAREAELVVTSDTSEAVVALHAVGLGIRVQWSAAAVDFNEWQVGATSQRRDVYVRNVGNVPLVVTRVDTVGDFTVQDLGAQYPSLPPGGDKMFWVWFKPVATGVRQGLLRVHIEGQATPESLALTGVGF